MSSCCEPPAFEPPAGPQVPGKFRTVALIGPPNSGKSTLFNRLTGLRQKVANYPGVTVEQRMGVMAGVGRDDLTLIDLPGIYSLTPYSEDARVAVEVLAGTMHGTPKPDAVLLVLDSQHLTRQLMLAAPILATGLPTLVLLNMTDLMEQRGAERTGGADQRGARHRPERNQSVSESARQRHRVASFANAAGDWQRGQRAYLGRASEPANGISRAAFG